MKLITAALVVLCSISSLASKDIIENIELLDHKIKITSNSSDDGVIINDANLFNIFGLFLKATNAHFTHQHNSQRLARIWHSFYPVLEANLERALQSAVDRDDVLSVADARTLHWLTERLNGYNPFRIENENYSKRLAEYLMSQTEAAKQKRQKDEERAEDVLPVEAFAGQPELYRWYSEKLQGISTIENRIAFARSIYVLNQSARMQLGMPTKPRPLINEITPPNPRLNKNLPMQMLDYLEFLPYYNLVFQFAAPREKLIIDLARDAFEKDTTIAESEWIIISPILKIILPKLEAMVATDIRNNGKFVSTDELFYRYRVFKHLQTMNERLNSERKLLNVQLDWLYSWIENSSLLIKGREQYDFKGFHLTYDFSSTDYLRWINDLTIALTRIQL